MSTESPVNFTNALKIKKTFHAVRTVQGELSGDSCFTNARMKLICLSGFCEPPLTSQESGLLASVWGPSRQECIKQRMARPFLSCTSLILDTRWVLKTPTVLQ